MPYVFKGETFEDRDGNRYETVIDYEPGDAFWKGLFKPLDGAPELSGWPDWLVEPFQKRCREAISRVIPDNRDDVMKVLVSAEAGDLLCFDGVHWQIARRSGIEYPVEPASTGSAPL